MVRKCRGIAKTAVVEMAAPIGARTRARAAASSGTASKRRKVGNTFSSPPPNAELSSQRCVVKEESVALRCTSRPSSGEAPASCCSSNGSGELAKEAIEFVDLEEEGGEGERWMHYCSSRERREGMPEADMVESTAEEADSGHGSTESEVEEFLAGAEKEIQKRFADKYNYDIGKDKPFEDGRFEWMEKEMT